MPDAHGSRRGVLITRPEPDASETARVVAERGWDPVIAPVLRVRPGRVAADLPVDAVLVTSRNAMPALDAYRSVRLLAVGQATAARATAAGFADVLHADGDAEALAGLAQRALAPGALVLVAHARGQGAPLIRRLREAGFRVRGRRAYSVIPAAHWPAAAGSALVDGRLHAATFLSAETARAFVRLLPSRLRPLLAEVEAATIGPAAAEVLTPLPWRRVRVSVRPTLDQVLALL